VTDTTDAAAGGPDAEATDTAPEGAAADTAGATDAVLPEADAGLPESGVETAGSVLPADEALAVADAEADTDPDDDDGELPTAEAVLRHVVSSLVDDPEAVRIDLTEGRSLPRLTVRVGPSDMGRVIGKRGRVAQAIRTVVRAAAVRDGTDVEVEFED
jgi:hypothetical protein